MKHMICDILSEPTGELYRQLFSYAVNLASEMTLIVRPDEPIGDVALVLLRQLSPFLRSRNSTSEWPGTQLLDGGTAVEHRFRYCAESSRIILAVSDRLYVWQQPDMPEDLALYYADGKPFLGTIAHERDAFISLDADLLANISHHLPGLRLSAPRT